MKDLDVRYHEAGHATAAYCFKMPIKSVSVYTANGESGRCRLGSGGDSSELEVATILVAGQMAEKCALGHREAFNWFDDDVDTVNAIAMVDALVEDGGFDGDVHEARRWVEVRARSLLVTKWRAVEAIAERLQKRTVLSGDEIVDICRREGVRRQGEPTKEKRTAPTAQDLRAEVAEIDRQIAKIKAQLNQPDDDPALWPLRRRLLDLHRKRRELLAQLEGGTHRYADGTDICTAGPARGRTTGKARRGGRTPVEDPGERVQPQRAAIRAALPGRLDRERELRDRPFESEVRYEWLPL